MAFVSHAKFFCFREGGSNGKVELSVRYQQHSEKSNLLGNIKEQVLVA